MAVNAPPRIPREDLERLRTFRVLPNLIKIPLFFGIMALLTWVAWTTESTVVKWSVYLALGYLWMSITIFVHDATHNTLFEKKWANWVFGIVTMIPLMVTFVTFKEDHLGHHRYNRSPDDPDAFTMGKRGVLDFIVFYLYFFAGALLSFIHFTFIYPIQNFNLQKWAIHLFEIVLKVVSYWALIVWAQKYGVLGKTLEVWLVPVYFFSVLNSMRFIAEHYETPWNQGQLEGTRTITSNPIHRFFWSNVNWHIGHHIYPSVPWYNLLELHKLLEPEIKARGAVIDKSYIAVFLKAFLRGPETEERLAQALARRRAAEIGREPSFG